MFTGIITLVLTTAALVSSRQQTMYDVYPECRELPDGCPNNTYCLPRKSSKNCSPDQACPTEERCVPCGKVCEVICSRTNDADPAACSACNCKPRLLSRTARSASSGSGSQNSSTKSPTASGVPVPKGKGHHSTGRMSDAFVYLTTMVTTTPVENKPQNSKIETTARPGTGGNGVQTGSPEDKQATQRPATVGIAAQTASPGNKPATQRPATAGNAAQTASPGNKQATARPGTGGNGVQTGSPEDKQAQTDSPGKKPATQRPATAGKAAQTASLGNKQVTWKPVAGRNRAQTSSKGDKPVTDAPATNLFRDRNDTDKNGPQHNGTESKPATMKPAPGVTGPPKNNPGSKPGKSDSPDQKVPKQGKSDSPDKEAPKQGKTDSPDLKIPRGEALAGSSINAASRPGVMWQGSRSPWGHHKWMTFTFTYLCLLTVVFL